MIVLGFGNTREKALEYLIGTQMRLFLLDTTTYGVAIVQHGFEEDNPKFRIMRRFNKEDWPRLQTIGRPRYTHTSVIYLDATQKDGRQITVASIIEQLRGQYHYIVEQKPDQEIIHKFEDANPYEPPILFGESKAPLLVYKDKLQSIVKAAVPDATEFDIYCDPVCGMFPEFMSWEAIAGQRKAFITLLEGLILRIRCSTRLRYALYDCAKNEIVRIEVTQGDRLIAQARDTSEVLALPVLDEKLTAALEDMAGISPPKGLTLLAKDPRPPFPKAIDEVVVTSATPGQVAVLCRADGEILSRMTFDARADANGVQQVFGGSRPIPLRREVKLHSDDKVVTIATGVSKKKLFKAIAEAIGILGMTMRPQDGELN